MMLATPTPPTSNAMAPRPRKSPVKALWASARATKASDGRLTFTWSGCPGFAVAARTDSTAWTWLGSART